MKVHVHAADQGGCGWYRLRWPAAVLAAQGHNVVLADSITSVCYRDGAGVEHVSDVLPLDADVVILQRPLLRATFELIAPLQRQGIAVVVEVDDDFHALPDGHMCKRPGVWSPSRSPRWLKRACEEADLVTTTTPALAARYGAHGRVVVLPNMVPASYLDVPAHDPAGAPVVGWTGSVMTHIGDLEATGGGVAAALRATGARFHVIGTGVGVRQGLGLAEHPSTTDGWVDIADYPAAYAGLDVAIVPLADNPFNEAKSDLKGLEALALGVPFVASSTGPYRELVRQCGAGVIAEPGQWDRWVRMLVEESDARSWLASRGRQYVKAERTYEGQAWRWMEAWSHAARTRRTDAVLT